MFRRWRIGKCGLSVPGSNVASKLYLSLAELLIRFLGGLNVTQANVTGFPPCMRAAPSPWSLASHCSTKGSFGS